MSPDSLPQLSLGTAALVIFVVCAAFVMMRGIARMLVGTAVLAAALYAGFHVWQLAPALAMEWIGKPATWFTVSLPVAAFLAAFLLLRALVKFAASPFARDREATPPSSITATIFRFAFALVPTLLVSGALAILVHHAGSVEEIRSFAEAPSDPAQPGWAERLKQALEPYLPAELLETFDPLAEPTRLALAKRIARQSGEAHLPVLDPSTGQPYPRGIVVDDPALKELARQGNFGTLLRHPLLTQALADPKVREAVRDVSSR